jgi:hypothetical protein
MGCWRSGCPVSNGAEGSNEVVVSQGELIMLSESL